MIHGIVMQNLFSGAIGGQSGGPTKNDDKFKDFKKF
jgi:hypothetical protein